MRPMIIENTLAQNIAAAGEKAAYDAACKRLLANKSILAWIMKSCVEEYREIDVKEIAARYIEGEPQIAETAVNPDEQPGGGEQIKGTGAEDSTMTEGTVTYDIRFYAIAPRNGELLRLIVNVEAQNDFYPGYPIIKRGLYYCSRMISSQYGVEFTHAHYEKIKKVYSIWICVNPPKHRENTIARYRIQEENLVGETHEKRENYDLLTAVMICLGNAKDSNYTGILKLLEVLLSTERKPEEKKRILQEDFDIEMTKALESEVEVMCNLSDGVEARGIEKGRREGRQEGIKEGRQEGIKEGRQEGRKEGVKEALMASIRNLTETMGWSVQQAMDALKIPAEERSWYAGAMKR